MEKQNRIIIVLLIFSLALNLGIVGVVIYHTLLSDKRDVCFKATSDDMKNINYGKPLKNENIDIEELRNSIINNLNSLSEEKIKYTKLMISGKYEEAKKVLSNINDIRYKIDIEMFHFFKSELAKVPPEKREIVFRRLLRYVNFKLRHYRRAKILNYLKNNRRKK